MPMRSTHWGQWSITRREQPGATARLAIGGERLPRATWWLGACSTIYRVCRREKRTDRKAFWVGSMSHDCLEAFGERHASQEPADLLFEEIVGAQGARAQCR